jgi:ketosteroid isomerase-like protein
MIAALVPRRRPHRVRRRGHLSIGGVLVADDPKAIVRRLFDALPAGDPDALARLLTDDVQWGFPGSVTSRGIPRVVHGRDAAVALVARSWRPGEISTWTLHRVIAEGDLVAVDATRTKRWDRGGVLEIAYGFFIRVAGHAVAELVEHLDTALVLGPIPADEHEGPPSGS